MLYFGAIAVILGVYMIWREYALYLDRELLYCRAFLDALVDYREKMKCYMDAPSNWAEGYCDENLTSCGFLDMLKSGVDLSEAYGKTRENMCLTDEVDKILVSCFSRLGEGYLDTELETLEVAIGKLTRVEGLMAENLSKRRKATGAVLGACAMGVVILVI